MAAQQKLEPVQDEQSATVQVTDLLKEFDVPEGTLQAVDSVDFELHDGEFVSLVGPSGCGKTTTLRCLAGLEKPTSGSIVFDGVDITDVPPNKRDLAMMFQNIALYPHMQTKDNIAYPLKVEGVSKEKRYEKAAEAADIMQISDLLEKYPGELSGGQRQRVALARTIVQEPQAFLMDEPLSDLDAKLKIEIRKEIQRVHRRIGKPTLYVTHDQEEAMTMSDRIAVMNDGVIEHIGTRDEIYDYPNNLFVAQFIGNPGINVLDGEIQELDEDHGRVTVMGVEMSFDVDRLLQSPSDSDVLVGFRPPSVSLGSSLSEYQFEGELELMEPIDDLAQATVAGPQDDLRARVPSDIKLQEGDQAQIHIDVGNLYLFDAESEELVAKAAE